MGNSWWDLEALWTFATSATQVEACSLLAEASTYFRSAECGTRCRSSSSLSLICSNSMCLTWHISILTENVSFISPLWRDRNNHAAAMWVIIMVHFWDTGAARDVPNRLLGCCSHDSEQQAAGLHLEDAPSPKPVRGLWFVREVLNQLIQAFTRAVAHWCQELKEIRAVEIFTIWTRNEPPLSVTIKVQLSLMVSFNHYWKKQAGLFSFALFALFGSFLKGRVLGWW